MSVILAAAKVISVDAALAVVFTMKVSHRLHRRLLEEDNMYLLALVIACLNAVMFSEGERARESDSERMALFSMTDTFVQLGGFVSIFSTSFFKHFDMI